jgi:isopenicillin N synthase-like dioxygenase
LAAQLEDAVRNVGFWIVTGHGIKDEEVVRQLALASAFFHLPMEEKVKAPIDLENDLNWG